MKALTKPSDKKLVLFRIEKISNNHIEIRPILSIKGDRSSALLELGKICFGIDPRKDIEPVYNNLSPYWKNDTTKDIISDIKINNSRVAYLHENFLKSYDLTIKDFGLE